MASRGKRLSAEAVCKLIIDDETSDVEYFFEGSDDEFSGDESDGNDDRNECDSSRDESDSSSNDRYPMYNDLDICEEICIANVSGNTLLQIVQIM